MDPWDNKLAFINECFFLVLGYHMFMFTDYNNSPAAKNNVGWSFVMVSIANFLFPNLYLVVTQLVSEVYTNFRSNEEVINPKEAYKNHCRKERLDLIQKYKFHVQAQ